jgi:hypothetical protein
LALFDVAVFEDRGASEWARSMLRLAHERGVACGALATGASLAERLDATNASSLLQFWLSGEDGRWPFSRALAFVGVEAGRAGFVSNDASAGAEAAALGIQILEPGTDDFERLLP